jgi:hypothetical protein
MPMLTDRAAGGANVVVLSLPVQRSIDRSERLFLTKTREIADPEFGVIEFFVEVGMQYPGSTGDPPQFSRHGLAGRGDRCVMSC